MSETVRIDLDTSGLKSQVGDVRDELTSLVENDLTPLAASMRAVFREMSESVIAELNVTAESGKASIKGMVDTILEDLARLAADEFIRKPLEEMILGGAARDPSILPGGQGGGIARSGAQAASLVARTLQQAGRNG